MKFSSCHRFSLIELTVVFAVLSILISLLSANLSKLSQASRLNECSTHLKTVYMATQLYVNDHDNMLPGPLLAGQRATMGGAFISSKIKPYVVIQRTLDGSRDYIRELTCPSNQRDDYPLQDNRRIHYRTHFERDSSKYFGYPKPGRQLGQTFFSIPKPSEFGYLRDMAQTEFTKTNSLPGWYKELSLLPSHFGTDYNTVYFDGRIHSSYALP